MASTPSCRSERSQMTKSEYFLVVLAGLLTTAVLVSYLWRTESPERVAATRLSGFQPPNVVRIENGDYESWRPPAVPGRLSAADQEDPELIRHIRTSWILPPPPAGCPRRLNHPERYDHSELGQSFVVDKLLHGLEHGVYVDVWAGNGETSSNTLFLEKDRHWDGLLVEPSPDQFRSLIGRRRRAYAINACASPKRTPTILNLTYHAGSGGGGSGDRTALVQCFPLYSIIRALGVRSVDYLSIRSQMELEILKTLPLADPEKLVVETLTVETHVNRTRRQILATNEEVRTLMTSLGYRWVDAGERINKRNVILQRKKTATVV